MRSHLLILALLAGAGGVAGCTTEREETVGAPAAAPPAERTMNEMTRYTGVLLGGMAGIGGEHTGWILQGDGETGGLEVDVSMVRDEAERLEGQRVTIGGRVRDKQYVERGRTPILVAEEIRGAREE